MTDTVLKIALAKMLPEVVYVHNNGEDFKSLKSGRYITDLEWLGIVSLAEAKLTDEEWHTHCVILPMEAWPNGWQDWRDTRDLLKFTWQQRTLTLCKTKGIAPTGETNRTIEATGTGTNS